MAEVHSMGRLVKCDVRQQTRITLSSVSLDDLTVITSSVVPESRWILPECESPRLLGKDEFKAHQLERPLC